MSIVGVGKQLVGREGELGGEGKAKGHIEEDRGEGV